MLLTRIFHYITMACSAYPIDESHGLYHSLNTLVYTSNILQEEIAVNPYLKEQERIIHTAALLHDMVDHKYIKMTDNAILQLRSYFRRDFTPTELDVIEKIITTCSYSKVKKDGFPDLGEYQTAYHIVRESDMLCAYDFDRAISYMIHQDRKPNLIIPNGCTFESAYENCCDFFEKRVFTQIKDDLFYLPYSKRTAPILQENAVERIKIWKVLYDTYKISGANYPIGL